MVDSSAVWRLSFAQPVRAGLIGFAVVHASPASLRLILNLQWRTIMKNLRQICLGLSLILALSMSAFAGDIHIPGRTCAAGEIGCPGITGPQESPGITGEIGTPGITGNISTPGITGNISTPGFTGDILTPGIVSLILAGLF